MDFCENICCVEHLARCETEATEVCPDCGQETCHDHTHRTYVACDDQEAIRERVE